MKGVVMGVVVLALRMYMSEEQDIGLIAPVNTCIALEFAYVCCGGMNAPQATHPARPPPQPLTLGCAICGYDIHDNPGGRCPECGGTLGDRQEWLVRQGWRQPRWIVILSMALPLLAAVVRSMAEMPDF